MRGAGDIVTHRLAGPLADKDCPGIDASGGHLLGLGGLYRQVLGCKLVHQIDSLVNIIGDDNGTILIQALGRLCSAA